MADKTGIEWTDATWNVVTGCSVVSPGCTNCYAMRLAGTRLRHHPSRAGLTRDTKAGPVWTGEARVNWDWIGQPIGWRRPRRIFVAAHGDLFHDRLADEDIATIWAVMVAAHYLRSHTLQILTKRPQRMRDLLRTTAFWNEVNAEARANIMDHVDPLARRHDDALARCGEHGPDNPPPGIWLGVSVEDQRRAEERIPILLDTPAAVRWVSAEPLLGALDLTRYFHSPLDMARRLGWVVVGGESGPNARPMHPDWARSLRDQCAMAAVPFLFKQHGEWIGAPDLRRLPGGAGPGFGVYDHCKYDSTAEAVRIGKRAAGRLLDGVLHDAYPETRHG